MTTTHHAYDLPCSRTRVLRALVLSQRHYEAIGDKPHRPSPGQKCHAYEIAKPIPLPIWNAVLINPPVIDFTLGGTDAIIETDKTF